MNDPRRGTQRAKPEQNQQGDRNILGVVAVSPNGLDHVFVVVAVQNTNLFLTPHTCHQDPERYGQCGVDCDVHESSIEGGHDGFSIAALVGGMACSLQSAVCNRQSPRRLDSRSCRLRIHSSFYGAGSPR